MSMKLVIADRSLIAVLAKSGIPCCRTENEKQARLSPLNKSAALYTPPVRLATSKPTKELGVPVLPPNFKVLG